MSTKKQLKTLEQHSHLKISGQDLRPESKETLKQAKNQDALEQDLHQKDQKADKATNYQGILIIPHDYKPAPRTLIQDRPLPGLEGSSTEEAKSPYLSSPKPEDDLAYNQLFTQIDNILESYDEDDEDYEAFLRKVYQANSEKISQIAAGTIAVETEMPIATNTEPETLEAELIEPESLEAKKADSETTDWSESVSKTTSKTKTEKNPLDDIDDSILLEAATSSAATIPAITARTIPEMRLQNSKSIYSRPKKQHKLSIFGKPKRHYSNRLNYDELVNLEAKVGRTVFGPIPEGHHREFFEHRKNVWFWHESFVDQTGNTQDTTVFYEVRPTGVFKKLLGGSSYKKIEGEELTNFRSAAREYLNLIKTRVYN